MRSPARSDPPPARRPTAAPRPTSGSKGSRRHDSGQATVEVALALPLLMLFLLAGVQVVAVVRAQLAVAHAAREGARAAAVSAAPGSAASGAARAAVDLGDLRVSTSAGGGRVRVSVRSTVRTDVPLVGALIGDVVVIGNATMAVEP